MENVLERRVLCNPTGQNGRNQASDRVMILDSDAHERHAQARRRRAPARNGGTAPLLLDMPRLMRTEKALGRAALAWMEVLQFIAEPGGILEALLLDRRAQGFARDDDRIRG